MSQSLRVSGFGGSAVDLVLAESSLATCEFVRSSNKVVMTQIE
jgi:hypothetical protein